MKIAVAGLFHETNTFSSMSTSWKEFESHSLHRGMDIIEQYRGTSGTIGGVIDATEEYGIEILPLVYAGAIPGGLVNDQVFYDLTDELCRGLKQDMDGILLVLHGAMVTESIDDAEGYLLAKVVETVGSNVPVVCTTDLHANISPEMIMFSHCLVGFDTYPHHDYYQRAFDAVKIIKRIINKEIRPVSSLRKPLMMPVVQRMLTDSGPMKDIIALAHDIEKLSGVINVTIAGGFPYSDIKWAGMSIIVTTDNNKALADELSGEIETKLWSKREEFIFKNRSVTEGIDIALQSSKHPFIIVDSSDNVGGGTSGDGTEVLAELVKRKVDSAAVIINDAKAVSLAEKVGVGNLFSAEVGGKRDNNHGLPVFMEGIVEEICEGIYHSERTKERIDMGKTAVINVRGLLLVLTSERVPAFDLEALLSLGINPEALKYIVVKGAIQWRFSYGSIARGSIELDSKGVTSSDLSRFNYTKIRRPIFPLDSV